MNWLGKSLCSSIGKKFTMGVMGAFLMLFLLGHLAGNMTLFANDGGEAFTAYADFLESIPILLIIEIVLAAIFLFHIVYATMLWYQNRSARPQAYAVSGVSENTSFSARTMIYSGSLILIFLVIHLQNFWWRFKYTTSPYHGSEKELYSLVSDAFKNPVYAVIYLIAMAVLGFHLNHAFQSLFQTLGFNHKKYSPVIKAFGSIYAWVVALGFAAIPVCFQLGLIGGAK